MNKIVKDQNKLGTYILTLENGRTFECKAKREGTKVDKNGKPVYNVIIDKIPADICGRTYIRQSVIDKAGSKGYEFENKTEHREDMGWRSRMTDDEKKQVAEAEAIIEAIKKACQERKPIKLDDTTIEGCEALIARILAKKAALVAKQAKAAEAAEAAEDDEDLDEDDEDLDEDDEDLDLDEDDEDLDLDEE